MVGIETQTHIALCVRRDRRILISSCCGHEQKIQHNSGAVSTSTGRKEECRVNTKNGDRTIVTTTLILTGILSVCTAF